MKKLFSTFIFLFLLSFELQAGWVLGSSGTTSNNRSVSVAYGSSCSVHNTTGYNYTKKWHGAAVKISSAGSLLVRCHYRAYYYYPPEDGTEPVGVDDFDYIKCDENKENCEKMDSPYPDPFPLNGFMNENDEFQCNSDYVNTTLTDINKTCMQPSAEGEPANEADAMLGFEEHANEKGWIDSTINYKYDENGNLTGYSGFGTNADGVTGILTTVGVNTGGDTGGSTGGGDTGGSTGGGDTGGSTGGGSTGGGDTGGSTGGGDTGGSTGGGEETDPTTPTDPDGVEDGTGVDLGTIEGTLDSIDSRFIDNNNQEYLPTMLNNFYNSSGQSILRNLDEYNKNIRDDIRTGQLSSVSMFEADKLQRGEILTETKKGEEHLGKIETGIDDLNKKFLNENNENMLDNIDKSLKEITTPNEDTLNSNGAELENLVDDTMKDTFSKYDNPLNFNNGYGSRPDNITLRLNGKTYTILDYSVLDEYIYIIRSLFMSIAYILGLLYFLRGSK